MPVQRTLCGYPIRLQTPPRRFQLLLALVLFVIVTLGLFGTPSSADIPSYEDVVDHVKNPHLPSIPDLPSVPNPFGPSAHKPPTQPNSTSSSSYRAIEWFSDFKWRSPFSSSTTLDENRAVLPPLIERPPIYTYYDAPSKQDKAVSEAENRLILTWRRAWWAQGFRPQVLSSAEAMEHPQYDLVQRLKLDKKSEVEIMRWLAWGHMGSGVLANWLAVPMAEHDNAMLSFLRRNRFPQLSYIDALKNAVLYGEGAAVNHAIQKFVDNPLFKNTTANKDEILKLGKQNGGIMINMIPKGDIKEDKKANGIAYYSTDIIGTEYKSVSEKLANSTTKVEGLDLLANLINSHLHLTFQESFPEGIAIVKPVPEHTTALMYEAIDIARNLTQCPTTPLPKSCPPNRLKCKFCDPAKLSKLELLASYKNSTSLYTVGTVPHPYTLTSLHYTKDTLDQEFLRRETQRNLWLFGESKELLGDGVSELERIVHFKETVVTPESASRSLWLTAERVSHDDLDYVFGFSLPQAASKTGEAEVKSGLTLFPRPGMPEPIKDVAEPEEKWIKNEEERLKKAREAIKSKDARMKSIVDMVEKWNLADTEAWKFSRAWSARRRVERKKWEEDEQKFAGSERKSGVKPGGGGLRWTDRI
ncbi:hypothetical protein K505DRAFT_326176 [Melanomma pulvis-pyrius CBS 109.77]|uniref:Uncharacterized protein n=1 Tax=Melanomma pulvis-pyrius CBS 109.77 TaxID=1314802 RepID=A0A6A6X7Y6_9PLEO|nr:hypothetical protein K505DRAFT_326176 [Melanomma pulvis-pyrius CBS 109.77]